MQGLNVVVQFIDEPIDELLSNWVHSTIEMVIRDRLGNIHGDRERTSAGCAHWYRERRCGEGGRAPTEASSQEDLSTWWPSYINSDGDRVRDRPLPNST